MDDYLGGNMAKTEIRLCACGCGGEVKMGKNQRTSKFLRGHHMGAKEGCKNPYTTKHHCQCGCGTEIFPLVGGHVNKFVLNHNRRRKPFTLEQRMQRIKTRWGREPILSPYLENTFVSFWEKGQRWRSCVTRNGKTSATMHANEVYRHHHGEIPKGMVVHHKNGKCSTLYDDRPENLMLLPDEWNLRFLPVLAKGFGVPEREVTDSYIEIFSVELSSNELFAKLCERMLLKQNGSKRLAV